MEIGMNQSPSTGIPLLWWHTCNHCVVGKCVRMSHLCQAESQVGCLSSDLCPSSHLALLSQGDFKANCCHLSPYFLEGEFEPCNQDYYAGNRGFGWQFQATP